MKNLRATQLRDARRPGLVPAAILAALLFHTASVAAQPQTQAELEAACEQQGFGEEECLSTRGCCAWDDGQCWAGDLEGCDLQLDYPITTTDEEEDANADEGPASPQVSEGHEDKDENDEADEDMKADEAGKEDDVDEGRYAEADEGQASPQVSEGDEDRDENDEADEDMQPGEEDKEDDLDEANDADADEGLVDIDDYNDEVDYRDGDGMMSLEELETLCEDPSLNEAACKRMPCCFYENEKCWAGEPGQRCTEDAGQGGAGEMNEDMQPGEADTEDDVDEANDAYEDYNDEADYGDGDRMMSLEEVETLCEDASLNEAACKRMPCCFYENEKCWAGEPGPHCREDAGQGGAGEMDEGNGNEDNDNGYNNEDGGMDDSNNNTPAFAGRSCLDEYAKRLRIEPVPDTAPEQYRSSYCQYTFLEAPSGRRVEIFGQSQLSSLQMYRARALLSFYLEDVPGSQYGSNKIDVLEIMAANRAKLDIPNGAHEAPGAGKSIDGQELYWSELPVEGDEWYMQNDWDHRDAAFEEILHLVHDKGIGVIEGMGVLPNFQEEILRASTVSGPKSRGGNGNWGINSPDWINELAAENSLTQEYLASVIDAYYGLWEAWTGTSGSMWGIYYPKGRNDIASLDPAAWELIPKFFNPYLTYMAYLSPTLSGTFKMFLDPDLPYTFKSQYLLHATLLGDYNVNLIGNDQDNRLGPNSGYNTLDGGEGKDTAIFQGRCAEYFTGVGGSGDGDGPPPVRFSDQVSGRDGDTMLMNIEVIEFSDSNFSFPFDVNDDGSLLCPALSPDVAEVIPSKELEDAGADSPGMQEEIAVPAVGSVGLKAENPIEGDRTNTTESHPEDDMKEKEEDEEAQDGRDNDPQAGDGTAGLEDEKDLGAMDELQPDMENGTDGAENQEYYFDGPDGGLAGTADDANEKDNAANESAANAIVDTLIPASPITIEGSEEQDMIVEAVGFLLNLPNLQIEDLESEAIMNDLKEALASGAGVTKDLVHILRAYAGSVVVDSQIVFPEAHRDAAVSFREALETNAITEVFKDAAPTLGLTAATVSQVSSKAYIDYREFKAANNIIRVDDVDYDESSAHRQQHFSQLCLIVAVVVTMAAVLLATPSSVLA